MSLLFLATATGGICNSGSGKEEDVPAKLSNSIFVSAKNPFVLRTFMKLSRLELPTEYMKYKVSFYKIKYKTNYKGKEIVASGIVVVPETEEEVPVLSFQHGTIASNDEAPSQLKSLDRELIIYQAVASTGIIVVVPDLIGFGTSQGIMHPYYLEDLTASTVIDNIYAAKNLAEELGLKTNGNLYLAGYSQGGYATMATHKFIEEQGIKGFELNASFPSAGGYDLKAVQEYFFNLDTYHKPFYLAYIAHAYCVTLDLGSDISCYFNEPYASKIPDLFNGSLSGSQINKWLNDTLSVLINPDFLYDKGTDKRFESLNKAFEENSLLDWIPSIKLYMYHGDADLTVPYQSSVDTYNQLIKNGASESVVTLTTLSGATHYSGIIPYVEMFVGEISKLEGF